MKTTSACSPPIHGPHLGIQMPARAASNFLAIGSGMAWLWLAFGQPVSAQDIPAEGNKSAAERKQDKQDDNRTNKTPPDPLAPLVPPGTGDPNKKREPSDGAFTFDWAMGGPPKSVRVGQTIELSFVLRYQPQGDDPLAPLGPGTMDGTVTHGILKPNQWPLTGLLKDPREHGGGLEYTGVRVGTEHLTMNYAHAGDKGRTVATFEVEPADYEVTFELERDGKMNRPLPGGSGGGSYHVTMAGQGGFSIKGSATDGGGFINGIGTRTATCKWNGGATVRGKQSNFNTQPVTGEGLISVDGKADADGNLTLSIGLGSITATSKVSGSDFQGKAINASSSAFAGGNVQSTHLKNLTFPAEGGTKEFSGPLPIPALSAGKSVTITDKGKVTVKRISKQN